MNIIVDTNIIFSAILNTEGKIASLLLSDNPFDFYAPSYVWNELSRHENKLLKILNIDSVESLQELKFMVTQKIRFISEVQIHVKNWKYAQNLTEGVDFDDIAFIALSLHLDGILWTGDKKLRNGLFLKGFDSVIDTQQLFSMQKKKG